VLPVDHTYLHDLQADSACHTLDIIYVDLGFSAYIHIYDLSVLFHCVYQLVLQMPRTAVADGVSGGVDEAQWKVSETMSEVCGGWFCV
jgi:hypothetical protein